ncbi:MAG: glycosyltransferase family A protein [Simkaniaceae bacterium]|nr:glycosyltransferase family A protein [Candidatus Sacchlamyda saccharinae]
MKIKLLFIALLVFAVGGYFAKGYFFPAKTKTVSYPIHEQKPFVIVVPSYNNSKYIEKNLRSIFTQNYENYRVIYIDDNSRDDTLDKAKILLSELDTKGRATLIHNPINSGALANIYNASHSCHDSEIVVLVDGDDYLAHENVLNVLNKTYANPNVWMSYGNYLDYPAFVQNPKICKQLPEKVIRKSSYRTSPWVTTHLRSFYASLVKEIKLSDLFYRGRFYSMASDLAIMTPLLELASPHIAFIDQTLYLYNRENPISDHKINLAFQRECHAHIASKTPYPALTHLPVHNPSRHTADLVIFSDDHPMGTYALLESLNSYVTGLGKTTIIYTASSTEIESHYLELQHEFPTVHFLKKEGPLKPLLLSTLDTPLQESPYIVFAHDTLILKDRLDLTKATDALEASKAHSLYFSHHQRIDYSDEFYRHLPSPPVVALRGVANGEIPFAWQFAAGTDDWNTPSPFSFVLFRKEDLKNTFTNLEFDSTEDLRYEWNHALPQTQVGLFYPNAKCIDLYPQPKMTKQQFCDLFKQGLKMDLEPFFQLQSPSKAICADVEFIPRN